MEQLARLACGQPDDLETALKGLPTAYEAWITAQGSLIATIQGDFRQAIAHHLIGAARQAKARISEGIPLFLQLIHTHASLSVP